VSEAIALSAPDADDAAGDTEMTRLIVELSVVAEELAQLLDHETMLVRASKFPEMAALAEAKLNLANRYERLSQPVRLTPRDELAKTRGAALLLDVAQRVDDAANRNERALSVAVAAGSIVVEAAKRAALKKAGAFLCYGSAQGGVSRRRVIAAPVSVARSI